MGLEWAQAKQEEEEEEEEEEVEVPEVKEVVEPEDSAEAIADFYEESSHNKLTLLSRPYSCHVQY